jgi:site-specific DNA recombinase
MRLLKVVDVARRERRVRACDVATPLDPHISAVPAAPVVLRAAVYPRVSTGPQEQDGTSLATQEERCRQYAAARGYAVAEVHVYREVHTGAELWRRPQLTRLREAIRRREIDVLVVFATDRLSRDPVHLGVILSEASHAGVAVEFVTEPLDNSPEGQLIRFIRGYAAKVELEMIRERSLRGKQARTRAGKLLPGNRARYGYRWNAERTAYLEHPETAPVVKRMFALFQEGWTLRAIAQRLSDEGVRTATGGAFWRHHTVRTMLADPIYTGAASAWRWKSVRSAKTGRTRTELRPSEGVPLPEGTVPCLVDRESFDAVQARLHLNRERAVRNSRHPELALLRGGFIRCGHCGRRLYARFRRDLGNAGGMQYQCTNGIEPGGTCRHGIVAAGVDGAVWRKVEAVLSDPEMVAAGLQRMIDADPTQDDLAAVDCATRELREQQRQMIEDLAYVRGPAAAAVGEKIAVLGMQLECLGADRAALEGRRRAWQEALERVGGLDVWCRTVAANVDALTYDEKRLALDALGVQVRLYRSGHDPRYEVSASISLDVRCVPVLLSTGRTPRRS